MFIEKASQDSKTRAECDETWLCFRATCFVFIFTSRVKSTLCDPHCERHTVAIPPFIFISTAQFVAQQQSSGGSSAAPWKIKHTKKLLK